MFERTRPWTIFCFEPIGYVWIMELKGFFWLVPQLAVNNWCIAHSQGQKKQTYNKNTTKNFVGLHNHFPLLFTWGSWLKWDHSQWPGGVTVIAKTWITGWCNSRGFHSPDHHGIWAIGLCSQICYERPRDFLGRFYLYSFSFLYFEGERNDSFRACWIRNDYSQVGNARLVG